MIICYQFINAKLLYTRSNESCMHLSELNAAAERLPEASVFYK